MIKGRSKAQRLRDKRDRRDNDADMPALAPTPRRASQGRARMAEIAPDIPTLEMRCRHAGIEVLQCDPHEPDKAKRKAARAARDAQMRDARAPWMGCYAGRAMASVIASDATRAILWDAIQHMRRVWVTYGAAIGAPSRYAKCLRLLVPTDAMAADAASPPLDTRSDEERAHQAKAAYKAVAQWLRGVEPRAAMVCLATVVDDGPCIDAAALVRTLHCVADGMAGREIQRKGVDMTPE